MAKLTIQLRDAEYQYLLSRCSARRKGKYISDLIRADMEGKLRLESEKTAYYHRDSKKKRNNTSCTSDREQKCDDVSKRKKNDKLNSSDKENKISYYHGDSKEYQPQDNSSDYKSIKNKKQETHNMTVTRENSIDGLEEADKQVDETNYNASIQVETKETLPASSDNQFLSMFNDFE